MARDSLCPEHEDAGERRATELRAHSASSPADHSVVDDLGSALGVPREPDEE
jgi:hypothetical protein